MFYISTAIRFGRKIHLIVEKLAKEHGIESMTYQKGALASLCLDLAIRSKSNGRHTLDSVMQQHYRDWLATRQGIPEKQWQARCQAFTGLDLEDFFQTTLYTTTDLPLAELLTTIGIGLQWQAQPRGHGGAFLSEPPTETPAPASDFGARFKQNSDHATLTHVLQRDRKSVV